MSCTTVRSDCMKQICAPMTIGQTKLVVNEKAWKSGNTTKNESRSVIFAPKHCSEPTMSCRKFECVSIAPFGLPVVPDV